MAAAVQVLACSWSLDNACLLTTTSDNTARLWNSKVVLAGVCGCLWLVAGPGEERGWRLQGRTLGG
jgi:hypothetical protein